MKYPRSLYHENLPEICKGEFLFLHYQSGFQGNCKPEKIYFSLKACDGGYSLLAADSDSEKTYAWISSLSKRFSLVEMIATGVVYVKDTRTDTYQPFISGKWQILPL